MKTYVIADIHGQYKALRGCLKASAFDYNNDRLIVLGDVCDRGPQVKDCFDELLKIKNLIYLLGNHDWWVLNWATNGQTDEDWLNQGGATTMASYSGMAMPKEHIALLAKAAFYFEENGRLFTHGGFDFNHGVKETPKTAFLWDRDLLLAARQRHFISPEWKFDGYEEIFIGHTPTLIFKETVPKKFCNVWALDTGAGYGQMLTIMDVETKKFWQAGL
jgi:serine/threonine protein phosphatase 1